MSDAITSYFVKNIVRVFCGLMFYHNYKNREESEFLKYYIIPERKLYSGKLTEVSAPKLAELLGQLIKEGHRVVEMIPLIY